MPYVPDDGQLVTAQGRFAGRAASRPLSFDGMAGAYLDMHALERARGEALAPRAKRGFIGKA